MLSCSITQSWPTLCYPMDYSPPGLSVHGDSPGKNTRVGCHTLFQGIFWSWEPNPGLLHCRWILYHLSHQGSPKISGNDGYNSLWELERLLFCEAPPPPDLHFFILLCNYILIPIINPCPTIFIGTPSSFINLDFKSYWYQNCFQESRKVKMGICHWFSEWLDLKALMAMFPLAKGTHGIWWPKSSLKCCLKSPRVKSLQKVKGLDDQVVAVKTS